MTIPVTRLLASTDEERALLEYVTRSARDFSLNHRPWSAEGSSRPQSSSRPSSSHSSLSSAAAVERLGPKINAFDVDAVAGRLRELVSLEKEALLEDIEALRRCLEDEAECMADAVGESRRRRDRDSAGRPDVASSERPRGSRGVYAEGEGNASSTRRALRGSSAGPRQKKKIAPALLQTAGGSSRLRRQRGGDRGWRVARAARAGASTDGAAAAGEGQGRRVQEESRIIA